MNPMVNNIVMWEKELEDQRSSRNAGLIRAELDQSEEPWPVQDSRWSFLVDLFRSGARRRQAVQGC